MKILCVHGWALRPQMWSVMNQRLQQQIDGLEVECADFGFAGELRLPVGHFDLAIGHSLGLLRLLDNTFAGSDLTFDSLVAVNGFTKFCDAPDLPTGCPQAVVAQMRERLATEPAELLRDFFANAAVAETTIDSSVNTSNTDISKLDSALADLIRVDGREQWNQFDGPRTVIAATGDRIVRPEHTEACFTGEDIRWVESDCHCLPVKFPDTCAEVIRELIEAR